MIRGPSEAAEQAAVFRWRDLMLDRIPDLRLLYSSQNGVRLTVGQAHKAKRGGMPCGVPDLHWPVARNGFHGLWIELKRATGGRLTQEQRWWGEQLRKQGHFVVVARGADRAIHWLVRYHGGTGLMEEDGDARERTASGIVSPGCGSDPPPLRSPRDCEGAF